MAATSMRRPARRKNLSFWNDTEILEFLNDTSDIEVDHMDDEDFFPGEQVDESDSDSAEVETDQPAVPLTTGTKRAFVWKKDSFQSRATDFDEDKTPALFSEPKTPFFYFQTFYPDQFFEDLAFQTNLYSIQTRGKSIKTNANELKIMTAIQILMGTVGMPQLRMYWSNSFIFPIVTRNMTRDRFIELRNVIHFVDNSRHDENSSDKLWKVRPLLNHFQAVCLTIPRTNYFSIDEQMIPFFGRCPARQYLPSKPNPVGLKMFVLAATDGAMLDFLAYQGKGTTTDEDNKKFGVGGSVIKTLVQSLPQNQGIFIFTDRFFTGLRITEHLLEQGIFLTGTVMANRTDNVAKKMKADNIMEKGEWDEWVREDQKIALLKWKDKKSVLLMSSAFGSSPPTTCLRWAKDEKKKIMIPQPAVVMHYNQSMGGVDLMDRFVAYYRNSTKTSKWPLRIFSHFIDLGVVNGWILHKRDSLASGVQKKALLTLMEFRLYVCEALIRTVQDVVSSPRVGRPLKISNIAKKHARKRDPLPLSDVRFDGKNHFPEHVPGQNQSKCRVPGCTGKSRVRCMKCSVFLCLQMRNCFLKFHTK